MQNTKLKILPELQTLLPCLTEVEFAGLEESMLKDGCLSPLAVWNDILIDGHHRYALCRKHQIPFALTNVVFDSLDDAKLWIWKHQENRRNLTSFQRAEIALKLKDSLAAKAKERQSAAGGDHKNDKVKSLPQNSAEAKNETRQMLAKLAEVSHDTLAKVEYITGRADEDTKEKLRKGEKGTSINKEYQRFKEQKAADFNQTVLLAESVPTPFPPRPNPIESYVPKTTLKNIPQDNPHILLGNLFAHFREGFVEDLVKTAVGMLCKKQGKPYIQQLFRELLKQFDQSAH